jgi:phosphoribosylformylglycinamidine synthase
MKFGVVIFPGSNCDHDAYHVVSKVIGQPVDFIWHKEEEINGYDAIILPGGFSYGDYLRTGAIARFSPVMRAVKEFSRDGGVVLGICNGFQILCEAGLLPGALLRACQHPRRARRHPVHQRLSEGAGLERPHRARGRQLLL